MPKEWTDDEVQAEINKAVQIVRQDKFEAFVRDRLSAPSDDKNDPKDKPPQSGDKSDSGNNSAKKRGLWWGDTES